MQATYTIPACNLAQFAERIAALNKRAAKLGVPAIQVATEPAYITREYQQASKTVWVKDGDKASGVPTGLVMQWYAVTVTGVAPKFDGWRFIATLEPIDADGEIVNLLMTVPGEVCPHEYRSRVGQCDHCCTQRRRKQTFVVQHDSGKYQMIGRQCLKDFLGHNNPHDYAAWAEMLIELGTLGESATGWEGSSEVDSYDLLTVLEWTASVIEVYGWVSKTVARESDRAATASIVGYLLRRPWSIEGVKEWEAERAKCAPNATHKADALAAKEWATDIDEATLESNNYLANCNAIAKASYVVGKTMGLACSIVSSHKRVKPPVIVNIRESNYVGTIGKRQEMTVSVVKIIEIEGQYGVTGLHRMVDADGNDLTWFASGGNWLEVGETYKVKATPKKHEEYKGRKQTILSRVTKCI